MSTLKDFYNNPNIEDEEEDEEEDSDFVPEENDSEVDDDRDLEEDDDDEEDVEQSSKTNKRSLAQVEVVEQSESNKKSRIDAIWAEMNTKSSKMTQETTPLSTASSPPVAVSSPPIAVSSSPKKNTTKRPKSTLSSLVTKYNIKEPKMNTLEKSKLDWQGYVDREGIRDDLKYKNKDGYMEKVAFLQRVDDRRLNQLKQGQQKGKKLE